ncbi:MAG: hypothetical protein K2J62_04455 [Bacteroidales bacterium]|nr:hypothetical protein [Bacteroidales bacterium]
MRKIFIAVLFIFNICALYAQDTAEEQKYRRCSLYSLLISHDKATYSDEIEQVFEMIPVPDKFDNHDLSVKIITSPDRREEEKDITAFLNDNKVANRLVAKWFDRDPETGICNVDLVKSRGLYDATYFDVELAKMSQRGFDILADAGEELIHNTFVVVNDIRYIDRNKGARVAGAIIGILAGVASAYVGGSSSDISNAMKIGEVISEIKGFAVIVTSYLYRLEWNDEIAGEFYSKYYSSVPLDDKALLEQFYESDAFKLTYVGNQRVKSGNISMEGVNTYDPIAAIRKVCTRSIDKSIAGLQRNYDEFKVKTPIFSVEPDITAKIGLKEGMSETSKYEILEQYTGRDGRTAYRRVGVIKPVKGKIWDNRYMAIEENAVGAELEYTTFKVISGNNFRPGMLIREIRN